MLPDRYTQAYPVLVAQYEYVTSFDNYARPGDMACDLPPAQIFGNIDSPTLITHPIYTILIGTNDVDVKGLGAYEDIFILCHQAAVSWLAVPLEYKVLAGSSGMTSDGPGELDKTGHWDAWTTAQQGASVSFTIKTVQNGPIYAWPRIDDNSPATYNYSLDGVVIGTGSAMTTPAIDTYNRTSSSLGFLRFPDVPAGTHTVTFIQTNQGMQGVAVVGIAAPSGSEAGMLPSVLVGTIPLQNHGNSKTAKCTPTDPVCLAYIQHLIDDVNLFAADGLQVKLFDTRQYMFATPAEMSDPLHPNVLGQQELSHSVEALW